MIAISRLTRWPVVLLGLTLLILVSCTKAPAGLARLDAEPLILPEPQGRWLAINYWAEWCKPCLKEIPELNRLANEASAEVLVLGVNFDGLQGLALREAGAKFKIEFDQLLDDPSSVFGFRRPSAIPATYLIDEDGKLAGFLVGPQTKLSLMAKIERLRERAEEGLE